MKFWLFMVPNSLSSSLIESSFFGLVFLLLSIHGFAQQKTYITTGSVVYEVNLETCDAREIFTTGAVFYDIAYSPTTGKLYGMNEMYLFEIDLDKLEGNTIMEVPIANSLTCDSRGIFYSFLRSRNFI